MDQQVSRVSGKKFYVTVAGKTNGAHNKIVENLRGRGQIEVSSPEDSDYLVVFCPIESRVGTDVGAALQTIEGGKPIILVVMHHTFNPDYVVADSRGQVDNPNVHLTVDCLFHEGRFLRCDRNEIAWSEIQRFLEAPVYEPSFLQSIIRGFKKYRNYLIPFVAVSVLTVVIIRIIDLQPFFLQSIIGVSGKKFYVTVAGKTNGAHNKIVENLRGRGQIEVSSPEDSDYLVVFCPIESRVGTDIGEALQTIKGGKPIILVVMHHTFNPDYVVADSRRQVDNPNVHLTVDCFFHEGRFLRCDRNEIAWSEIQRFLEAPVYEPSFLQPIIRGCKKYWKQIAFFGFSVLAVVIVRNALVWSSK